MDFDELRHLENDEDFISIETLMNEFDCLNEDNHQLWYLYKQYNLKYFDDEEIEFLDNVINKLKSKSDAINRINMKKLKPADLGTINTFEKV